MDIAREAYGKAEALEARGYPSAHGVAFSSLGGGSALVRVRAGTLVCLTATVTGTGGAKAYLGGAEVAEFTVPGTSSAIFAAAEDGEVSVKAEGGAEFSRVALSYFGEEAESAYSPAVLRADGDGTDVYALVASGGYATVYKLGDGAFSVYARIGACDDADVCAYGPAAAYCSGGRAYVVHPGSERGSVYLGRGKLAAICRCGEGYLAAAYDGSKVTVYKLAPDLTPLRSASCHGSPTVDSLAFVKGAASPKLAVSDSGRILLRRVSLAGDAETYRRFTFTEGGENDG